jgi:hypothetical protein
MLWSWAATLILDVFRSVLDLLPTGGFVCPAAHVGDVCLNTPSIAADITPYVGAVSYFIPVTFILSLLQGFVAYFVPAMVVCGTAVWAWFHSPSIAGTGSK